MLPNINRNFRPDRLRWAFIGMAMLWVMTSCNTRIEGCLQANAENFDLNAEKACDGCCTYPSVSLSISQKWNDRNFANTDTLYDVHGQAYRIQDLRYYLTSWSWKDADGAVYTVDSVNAECGDAMLTYTPDIVVVDTRQFSFTLGTIRQSPEIQTVTSTLGLTEDFSCLDWNSADTPDALTDASPLWNPATQRLETIRLVLQKDIDLDVFDTLFIHTRLPATIAYTAQWSPGIDTQLKLSVNYGLWFKDADLEESLSFEVSINTNFAGSISQSP